MNPATLTSLHTDDWSVNLNDSWQVLLWCRELGLTKTQLESAVQAAGPQLANVRHFLGDHGGAAGFRTAPAAGAVSGAAVSSVRNILTRAPF